MAQRGKNKQRSSKVYQKKVNKIRKWYGRLEKIRKENSNPINKNTKEPVKRRELKPIDFYIDKIKKATEGR